ncbi:MAG: SemiSWEET transporter [Nitrospinota bacterium]
MQEYVLIGYIAGALTTFAFLPQVIKTWRMRETKDISLLMLLVLITGILLWLIYGFLLGDLPLIAANSATLILVVILLFFKLKYK